MRRTFGAGLPVSESSPSIVESRRVGSTVMLRDRLDCVAPPWIRMWPYSAESVPKVRPQVGFGHLKWAPIKNRRKYANQHKTSSSVM